MGVEQTTIIDFIGIDAVSGAVYLTIADALDWNADHLRLLQGLRLQHRPDAEATLFLEQARALIGKAGVALHYGSLASGYANDNA